MGLTVELWTKLADLTGSLGWVLNRIYHSIILRGICHCDLSDQDKENISQLIIFFDKYIEFKLENGKGCVDSIKNYDTYLIGLCFDDFYREYYDFKYSTNSSWMGVLSKIRTFLSCVIDKEGVGLREATQPDDEVREILENLYCMAQKRSCRN